ncbi:MAG: hypothetical protein ACR2QS_01140 [Woeseiaceae bacterium]
MDELETWEFGSLPWCEFAASLGVRLLRNADLDLDGLAWGFSEEYSSIPARLLGDRQIAGYHLMIKDGAVSGGPSIPDECLALPGFHVAEAWPVIAHSSYLPFNTVGNQERGEAHIRLRRELHKVGIGDGKWVLAPHIRNDDGIYPRCRACGSDEHEREDCPVWPPGVGEALGNNPDAAAHRWRLKRSAELEGFPESEWGVPLLHELDQQQKERFLGLLDNTLD